MESTGDAAPTGDAKTFGGGESTDDAKSVSDAESTDDANSMGDPESAADAETGDGTDVTRSFLRVDGMHSVTCEAFLEALAEGCEGVAAAEASYVTETVRVDHDPDRVSRAALCETLTTTGYTAVPREEAPIDSNAATGRGDRQLDSVLGYRYAAGVLFGSFLMLTYVAVLYPAHLSRLLGEGALPMFEEVSGLSGEGALLVLPLFFVLTGVVLLFTGLPLLRGAYASLTVRRPNTELLAAITVVGAYLYSTVAVLVGRGDVYFDLTIVVAAAVVAAVFYESLVKQRAMDRLTDLTVSRIDEARRYDPDGTTRTVPVDGLGPDDRVLVREGERVPVDGVLATGECTVDEAVVTGESLPAVKREGDDVVGGSVVTEGAAVLEGIDGTTSSVDRLVTTVWNLQSADHGVQRGANRLAARVAPVVVAAAVVVGGARLVLGSGPAPALLGALTVLLAASPWALGLATPLSVATTVDEAMRRGVVVFDETIFERLRAVDVVVFDKTGTLTTGETSVVDADAPDDVLTAAAALERRASHPAAEAIADEFSPEGGVENSDETDHDDRIRQFESHPTGVEGVVGDEAVLVGHPDLFADRGWSVGDALRREARDARGVGRLPVLVGRDGRAEGLVVVGDEPRDRWDEAVSRLGDRGIDVVVLTGDDEDAAEFLRRHPGVDHVFAGVPPAGKTATVRRLQADGTVAMVGDGTNDAPALARADLGVALGSGTAVASDAADVAIVADDLAAVETAFDLARAAGRRVSRNTALALVYNAVAIPLAAVGLFNPLLAMAAVVATGGLLAANSFRPLLDD